MVDVVPRSLASVVDEDDAVEVIALPEDETQDGKRGRHGEVVESYSRSAVMLRRKQFCKQVMGVHTLESARGSWL